MEHNEKRPGVKWEDKQPSPCVPKEKVSLSPSTLLVITKSPKENVVIIGNRMQLFVINNKNKDVALIKWVTC